MTVPPESRLVWISITCQLSRSLPDRRHRSLSSSNKAYHNVLQGMIAMSGSATAYSAAPGKKLGETAILAGTNVGLAALMQSRNGARVAVVGSVDLFSDAFCKASVPARGGCVRYLRLVTTRLVASVDVYGLTCRQP